MTTLMATDSWTPTQRRMMAILADGQPHRRCELHACLADELGAISNIHAHLSGIRKRLRPAGRDVVCEYVSRRICYRLVVLVRPADALTAGT